MLFGMCSPSPEALLCPTWDPNSTEIPSVLVNELRLLLCPSILANSADWFGFSTLWTSQPSAEIGCLHLLDSHLSGLVCLPVLLRPSHISPLHPTPLVAQTVQQHRQTGSHPLPPAPASPSCFHPSAFLYWPVKFHWWEEISLLDPLARQEMKAFSLSPQHTKNTNFPTASYMGSVSTSAKEMQERKMKHKMKEKKSGLQKASFKSKVPTLVSQRPLVSGWSEWQLGKWHKKIPYLSRNNRKY